MDGVVAYWFAFFFCFCLSAPFNRNTAAGYVMYFIIQVVLLHCYFAGLVPSFSFFLGSCFYMEASCADHAEQLTTIDGFVVSRNCSRWQMKMKNVIESHIGLNE